MNCNAVISNCRNYLNRYRRSWRKTEAVFSKPYYRGTWSSSESHSGSGSELSQTQVLIKKLPEVLRELKVQSMLDLPCGDFNWMQKVDLSGISYIGADVVTPIVKNNQRLFARPGRRFLQLNLIVDNLPNADLVFTRDCLVHLSFDDIFRALKNVCRTEAKYLAMTTFTNRNVNNDIPTGAWRVLNMEAAPFSIPPPIYLINEQCTECDGIYSDKSLGFWSAESVKNALRNRP